MSYILDALRRADAERERGRVPGLHAQTTPMRTAEGPGRARPPHPARRGPLAAMLLGLAGCAALAWWWFDRTPAAEEASPSATSVTAAPAPAASMPPAPLAPPPPPAPQATAPVQPILAPPPPAPPAPPPAPTRQTTAPKPAPANAPSAAAAPDPATLPRFADLPPDARVGLPPLQVSGATYAENPALRMLIIDGKVLQQGQDIAPGLTLETIGPRTAVVNHQGRRLRLTY